MVDTKTAAPKKSKRGARRAAPSLTVQSQLIGKLGPTCFGQMLDKLHRTARPPRRRKPKAAA